ncbi:NAD-dependent epimerase/dehydratase family protein [Sphingobacterium multivorum]|uniref:NAD-dependent epimerase/dehydratase family protein n=1 Tax=Sphingobacterium multivorum TaxID=28454 RepID=UPI003DA1CF8D
MTTKKLVLVSGANGHLGNNLVRLLLTKGFQVRASVRNLDNNAALKNLPCELVAADITDKASFVRALQGVDTFYAVGAAFKLWARDLQKEIYDVNMQGTRNTIEAAAEAGVKKIIYVSSIAALDYTHTPTKESNGYNPDRRDAYYNSKNDGEKLAFKLAAELGIELVSVMLGAMIGSESSLPFNVSYDVLPLF